jgi:hypothetical protein
LIPNAHIGLGFGLGDLHFTNVYGSHETRNQHTGQWDVVGESLILMGALPLTVSVPIIGCLTGNKNFSFENLSLNATISPWNLAKKGERPSEQLLDVNLCYTPGALLNLRAGYLGARHSSWSNEQERGGSLEFGKFYLGVEADLGGWWGGPPLGPPVHDTTYTDLEPDRPGHHIMYTIRTLYPYAVDSAVYTRKCVLIRTPLASRIFNSSLR